MRPIADDAASQNAADAAIARVLGAERDARDAVERARLQVGHIAENARAQARSVAERTERRIRSVVAAFERELAARLDEIDAEAARLDSPQPVTEDELQAVRAAVRVLARESVGVKP